MIFSNVLLARYKNNIALLLTICARPPGPSPKINSYFMFWGGKEENYQACKQLLDSVFVISGIIKVERSVISRSRRSLTETLIIQDITKTESQ